MEPRVALGPSRSDVGPTCLWDTGCPEPPFAASSKKPARLASVLNGYSLYSIPLDCYDRGSYAHTNGLDPKSITRAIDVPEASSRVIAAASVRPFASARIRRWAGIPCVFAAFCTLLPMTATAAPLGYTAVGIQGDQLAEINMADGSLRIIGSMGGIGNVPFADVEGMALDSKGRLFAVSDLAETLLRVDITTGAAAPIGPLFGLGLRGQGAGPFNQLDFGLSFTCDGRLWLSSDAVKKLWEIDTFTGVAMLVGDTGVKISALAGYDNDLYGLGVDEDEGLYQIDRETGAATLIGRTGLPYSFYDAGMDFDAEGNLWATLDFNPPPSGRNQDFRVSEIVQIDRETGLAGPPVLVQGASTIEVESLALAPTICVEGVPPVDPEPIIVDTLDQRLLALLAAVMLAIGMVAARRR